MIFAPKDRVTLPEGDSVSSIYVEMKNKHNTLNSSASAKTYIKMQGQLLSDDDCACFLVEVIAKRSQNIAWTVSVDGTRHKHKRIRRVSIDKFYEAVTGEPDAFYRMCMVLPRIIDDVVNSAEGVCVPDDTVLDEIKQIADMKGVSFVLALYMTCWASGAI